MIYQHDNNNCLTVSATNDSSRLWHRVKQRGSRRAGGGCQETFRAISKFHIHKQHTCFSFATALRGDDLLSPALPSSRPPYFLAGLFTAEPRPHVHSPHPTPHITTGNLMPVKCNLRHVMVDPVVSQLWKQKRVNIVQSSWTGSMLKWSESEW